MSCYCVPQEQACSLVDRTASGTVSRTESTAHVFLERVAPCVAARRVDAAPRRARSAVADDPLGLGHHPRHRAPLVLVPPSVADRV